MRCIYGSIYLSYFKSAVSPILGRVTLFLNKMIHWKPLRISLKEKYLIKEVLIAPCFSNYYYALQGIVTSLSL